MTERYRYFDHTADLGIEIFGNGVEALFENTGHAIFETQIEGRIKPKAEKRIELEAGTLDDLLIDWCRELLYLFSVHHFIPRDYSIKLENYRLFARIRGDSFAPERHNVRIEIKNVTYHNFRIERQGPQYKATIVFDV